MEDAYDGMSIGGKRSSFVLFGRSFFSLGKTVLRCCAKENGFPIKNGGFLCIKRFPQT